MTNTNKAIKYWIGGHNCVCDSSFVFHPLVFPYGNMGKIWKDWEWIKRNKTPDSFETSNLADLGGKSPNWPWRILFILFIRWKNHRTKRMELFELSTKRWSKTLEKSDCYWVILIKNDKNWWHESATSPYSMNPSWESICCRCRHGSLEISVAMNYVQLL